MKQEKEAEEAIAKRAAKGFFKSQLNSSASVSVSLNTSVSVCECRLWHIRCCCAQLQFVCPSRKYAALLRVHSLQIIHNGSLPSPSFSLALSNFAAYICIVNFNKQHILHKLITEVIGCKWSIPQIIHNANSSPLFPSLSFPPSSLTFL